MRGLTRCIDSEGRWEIVAHCENRLSGHSSWRTLTPRITSKAWSKSYHRELLKCQTLRTNVPSKLLSRVTTRDHRDWKGWDRGLLYERFCLQTLPACSNSCSKQDAKTSKSEWSRHKRTVSWINSCWTSLKGSWSSMITVLAYLHKRCSHEYCIRCLVTHLWFLRRIS